MTSTKALTTASDKDQESLKKLLEACLLQRISADKWEQLTRQLLSQIPLTVALSEILLDESRIQNSLIDPLYPGYISRALTTQLLPPHDVLHSFSKVLPNLQPGQEIARYPILRIICQGISLWKPSSTSVEHVQLLWDIEQILHRFVNQEDFGQDHVLFIETVDAWSKLLTSQPIRPLLKAEKKNTDRWKVFENDIQDLRNAAATKLPLEKAHELETVLTDFLVDLTTANGINTPPKPELPKIHILDTRAALMMLLISLRECMGLGATDEIWTTVDRIADGSSGREIFAALILAAFDALSVVLKRSDMSLSSYPDPMAEVALYQSLLVNRIPALLATRRDQYAIPHEDIEYSVLEVFTKADPILMNLNVPAIPNLEGDDTGNFPPRDFRQDFMYSMVSFGLLDIEAPSRILGIQVEQNLGLMDVKDIVEEAGDVMDEESAVERLIGRLSNLDGNQSVIVSAILELVQMWVSSHNIHSLSLLCAGLMKEPGLIDQVFLHTSIPSLIEPLREFLDNWTIDEEDDNGEHQLIYEQYNSILFLICYCVHHFGRQHTLDDPDGPGFVRTWLREFSKAKWLDMLSDEDSNAIGTWITALFDGDGISDDLVRMSPPYKWLLISTTLFQQSVSAYRQGVFQLKTLKDGFEYFTQPFLEPCLLGAIHYLTTQLKIATPDAILPYLEILSSLLVFLSPTQQEDDIFSTMNLEQKTSRVLQILAPSILRTISQLSIQQATPVKHHLDPIVETLRPYSNQFRPDIAMNRKDIITTLRGTLSNLAQWSAGWGSGYVVPPGVDLRYIGAAAQSFGSSVAIRHIVDEIWAAEQTSAFHAVVVGAMFLTVPFEMGFGKESLAERFLLMLPGKDGMDGSGLRLGRSLGPIATVVKRIMGVEHEEHENNVGEKMVED